MFCRNCGKSIPDASAFCPECGLTPNMDESIKKQPLTEPKKPIYKKWWFWLLIAVVLILIIASIEGGDNNTNDAPPVVSGDLSDEASPIPSSEPGESDAVIGAGTLGDFLVSIDGYVLTQDYEGKPAVVINFTWANNSEETTSFAFALNSQVFQNDIECETAIVADTSVYNAENYLKDIKPGASLAVQLAYVLQDGDNPISVELKELFSLDDETVTQAFEIAQ